MNATMLGVAILVAAPGLKDEPKKDADICGEWLVETMTLEGKPNSKPSFELVYRFTSDGQWLARRDGVDLKTTPREIKVDGKTKPSMIDVIYKSPRAGAAPPPNMLGIYKVDGDVLTICFGEGGSERPKTFETPDGANVMLMTLKRSKKKD